MDEHGNIDTNIFLFTAFHINAIGLHKVSRAHTKNPFVKPECLTGFSFKEQ